MAEEIKSGQIKLKVDPRSLRQEKLKSNPNEARQVVTEREIHGRTVNLKKDDAQIEVVTAPVLEALPMKVVEAQRSKKGLKKREDDVDVQKKQRKHPKRVLTEAEKAYYRVLVISIFSLVLLLVVGGLSTVGFFSYYLLSRVIENPAHGYTLRNASIQMRKAESLSEKYNIMIQAYNEVRGADLSAIVKDENKGSKYKGILGDVEKHVNKMHSVDETLPEAPEMKNTSEMSILKK